MRKRTERNRTKNRILCFSSLSFLRYEIDTDKIFKFIIEYQMRSQNCIKWLLENRQEISFSICSDSFVNAVL